MLSAYWKTAPLLGRLALCVAAIALGLEAWSFVGSAPPALFVVIHLGVMALFIALITRLGYHHWLYMGRGTTPTWDPFAPRMRLGRGVLLLLAAAANMGAIMLSTVILAVDASVGPRLELRLFASSWAFFALVVVVFAPIIERRIAARQQRDTAAPPGRAT